MTTFARSVDALADGARVINGTVDSVRGLTVYVHELECAAGRSCGSTGVRDNASAARGGHRLRSLAGDRDAAWRLERHGVVRSRAPRTGQRLDHGRRFAGLVASSTASAARSTVDPSPARAGEPPALPPGGEPDVARMIDEPLATGVRAIDGMTTLGKGQRIGIFAGPGVGKSHPHGVDRPRHAEADVNVIALVGERGREVKAVHRRRPRRRRPGPIRGRGRHRRRERR